MRNERNRGIKAVLLVLLLLAGTASLMHSQNVTSVAGPLPGESLFEPAMQLLLGPYHSIAQYDYIMTGKVRLLLFWIGADDVGGGYIRRSVSRFDPSVELIQVLFGSDPAKAPRGINNWGAATEAVGPGFSALFGFRKSANTDSAAAAQAEIRSQVSKGQHAFEGIITVAGRRGVFSRIVPVLSNVDLTLHQLDQGQEMFSRRLIGGGPIKELKRSDLRCERARGFLDATNELIEHALNGEADEVSRCYVHNARNYTVTLESRSTLRAKNIHVKRKNDSPLERSYRNLLKTRFSVLNHQSGKRSSFELLLGTVGDLRGVPVQIVHQPNWWFRVVLNLAPGPRFQAPGNGNGEE